MLKHSKILLAGIVLLAAILRFYQISTVPPALNWDEISHGYNAYSILKTGKDEWGVSWPTIFRAYGDYKLPVYVYLTAVSEALFGLNAVAVRLPSVLAGIGLVIFSYLLARKLYGDKVGLLTGFLVAVEPWSFFLSRGAFEANLGAFFIVSGIFFLLFGVEKAKHLPVAVLLLGLSVFTYNSARIFVPLFLLFFFLVYRNQFQVLWQKRQRFLLMSAVVLFAFLGGMFWQMITGEGQARYKWLAILDEGAVAEIVQRRQESMLPESVERFVYNRPVYFVEKFAQNYIVHFSPKFLFITGGDHYQFSVPKYGLLYLVELPLFFLGIMVLLKGKTKEGLILLGWLLLTPIPSSLTRDSPHVLRSITLLPVPMILTALGIIRVLTFLTKNKKKMLTAGVAGYLLLISLFADKYFIQYFTAYPRDYSWAWQYGYKEAVEYTKGSYDRYDQIIVTKKYGEPHEFFLFYWPWDPEKYRNDPKLERYAQSDWFWVDSFDKFIFVNDWEIPKTTDGKWMTERKKTIDTDKRSLLVTSPGNYPPGWEKLEAVNFLDDKPAFDILENDATN